MTALTDLPQPLPLKWQIKQTFKCRIIVKTFKQFNFDRIFKSQAIKSFDKIEALSEFCARLGENR